jgi:hypothetical protein
MAEIEAEAEINADGIIYGKRFYRHDGGDLDIKADVDVDVDAVHHGHRYARRGLLNNQNGVKGAVDVSIHSLVPRSMLTYRLLARPPTTLLASEILVTATTTTTHTTTDSMSTPKLPSTLTQTTEYTGPLGAYSPELQATLGSGYLLLTERAAESRQGSRQDYPLDHLRMTFDSRTQPPLLISYDVVLYVVN